MRFINNRIARKVCRNGLLLSAGLLSAFGFLQITENKAYAAEVESITALTYQEGATFVPDNNVQIKIDDENSVSAKKGIIKFPDGKVYDVNEFTLTERGVYELTYYGEYAEQKVSASKTFVVTDTSGNVDSIAPTVSISGKSSFKAALNEEIAIKTEVNVTDDTYYGNLKTAVYFNYGTEQQSSVYMKDGKFTPKNAGKYSVVYTATDGYGNVGQKVLTYTATEGSSMTYTEPTKLESLVAGKEYVLERVRATGLNGLITSEIFITNPLDETQAFKNRAAEFTPEILGEYTITYTFTDSVYVKTFSYKVNCENTENAVLFRDMIGLPRYFIKDATYTIDEYLAYKPSSEGLKGYATDVYVKADGAAEYSKVENPLEYKVAANESLQFKYDYEGKFIESEIIPVQTNIGYDSEEINYLNYFIGNHTASAATIDSFTFTFDGSEATGTLDFINPIAFQTFNFEFKIANELDNFTELHIILTDYLNPENVNEIVYTKTQTGFMMQANENAGVAITNKAFAGELLTFGINSSEKIIRTNLSTTSGSQVSAVSFAYNEFESYLCHLQIQVKGISEQSQIAISKLNNQSFKDNLVIQKPEASVKTIKGAVEMGSVSKIYPISFNSVFYPTLATNATVTVTNPLGLIVTSKDGISLKDAIANREYEIDLSIAGSYIVKYTAKILVDGKEYTRTSSSAINVINTIAPIVTFENGANSDTVVEIKVGELHTVYGYTATDDVTDGKNIHTLMVVYNEQNFAVDVLEKTVAFNKVGTYRIVVYARDGDGNIGSNSYTVVVR